MKSLSIATAAQTPTIMPMTRGMRRLDDEPPVRVEVEHDGLVRRDRVLGKRHGPSVVTAPDAGRDVGPGPDGQVVFRQGVMMYVLDVGRLGAGAGDLDLEAVVEQVDRPRRRPGPGGTGAVPPVGVGAEARCPGSPATPRAVYSSTCSAGTSTDSEYDISAEVRRASCTSRAPPSGRRRSSAPGIAAVTAVSTHSRACASAAASDVNDDSSADAHDGERRDDAARAT